MTRRGGPSGGQDTAAERLTTHRQRRVQEGLKRIEEWVPPARVPDLRAYARLLREAPESSTEVPADV